MKKILIVLLSFFLFQMMYGEEEYVRGKILSLEDIITADSGDEEVQEVYIYRVKFLSGDRKGEEVSIEYPVYREEEYNIGAKPGDKVVLYYESNEIGDEKYYISDIDKRSQLLGISGLFILLTLFISKKNGLKALLALGITVLFVIKVFIPSILLGYSPILFSVITGIFSTFVTIYLMTGFEKKGFIAIVGTLGGVLFAGILSYIAVNTMRLTGYETTDSLSFASYLKGIKLRELISAGVIIGSMGAVMDVAMSMATAMHEIHQKKSDIGRKELFYSAMKMGNDMIGTMVNTLILAYIGGSLLLTVMVYIQREQFPMIRLLNFENIATEILRSISGSIGILICVPITAYVGSILYGKKTKR